MFHCLAFFSQRQDCLDTSLLWSFYSDFIYDRVQCLIEVFVLKSKLYTLSMSWSPLLHVKKGEEYIFEHYTEEKRVFSEENSLSVKSFHSSCLVLATGLVFWSFVHIEKVPALISYLITIDSQCKYIISWHSLSNNC